MSRTGNRDVLQERTTITADAEGSKILHVQSSSSVEMWVKLHELTADAEISVLLEGTIDPVDVDDPVWATVKKLSIKATTALVTELTSGPVAYAVGAVRANGDAIGDRVRCRVSGLAAGDTETLDFEVAAMLRW